MVKFNFSSVFLTLTAASALVFALPTPNENTNLQAEYAFPSPHMHPLIRGLELQLQANCFCKKITIFLDFRVGPDHIQVEGKADGDIPILTIKLATYTYHKIDDFRGPFDAIIGPKKAFITFADHFDAVITGTLDNAIGREVEVTGTFTAV